MPFWFATALRHEPILLLAGLVVLGLLTLYVAFTEGSSRAPGNDKQPGDDMTDTPTTPTDDAVPRRALSSAEVA